MQKGKKDDAQFATALLGHRALDHGRRHRVWTDVLNIADLNMVRTKDDKDENKVLKDHERLRVPLQFMDSVQRSIYEA